MPENITFLNDACGNLKKIIHFIKDINECTIT